MSDHKGAFFHMAPYRDLELGARCMEVLLGAHTLGEPFQLEFDTHNIQDLHGRESFAHGHNQELFLTLEFDKVCMVYSTGVCRHDHLGTFLSMDFCRQLLKVVHDSASAASGHILVLTFPLTSYKVHIL